MVTDSTIVSVGVTFGDADPVVRRALALDAGRADVVRRALARERVVEAVLVATCHRTEVVMAAGGLTPAAAIGVFHRVLSATGPTDRAWCLDAGPRVFVGPDAVEHVFRVACGLDSALLGDADVLGQLRAAWHAADAAGSTGRLLRRLFRDAFAVGRRARAATTIGAGGAGVGSAVAAALEGRPGAVLLIGAGAAATTIGRRLAKHDGRSIVVLNRSFDRAARLAGELGGRAGSLTDLRRELAAAHVVVTAVGAPQPIVAAADLHAVRAQLPWWRPLIVDAGSPPDVETAPGFDIVGLDSLAARAAARDRERRAAVSAVSELIAAAVARHGAARSRGALQCVS